MTLDQLEAAAFWQSRVCLSCEHVEDDESFEKCPACGSDNLVEAELALRCVKLVESE